MAEMFIIRRADGEPFGDEYAFYAVGDADDWLPAEEADHDDDTAYEILECRVIKRKMFYASNLCPVCFGEEEIDGKECVDCGGSGERPEAIEEIL
jgi:hypothetical protein